MNDLLPDSPQHHDRDTRDLSPKPRSDFEEALDVVRAELARSMPSRSLAQHRLVLIALDIVAAPARAVEVLDSEFSLFTFREKGQVVACVQDENCERKYETRGASLREALNAAAHAAQAERRAAQLDGE